MERILLGLLWLLAATLGTCFWFGTRFGFNVFSAQHWQYLAYMQATRQPVRPLFYISLTLAVVVMLGGFYIIMRPHLRRINLVFALNRNKKNKGTIAQKSAPTQAPAVTTAAPAPEAPVAPDAPDAQSDASQIVLPPSPPAPEKKPTPAPPRPPRLTLPRTSSNDNAAFAPAPVATPPVARATAPAPREYPELNKIFTDAGYVVKRPSKIGPLRPDLIAIGTDEVIWIGAVGAERDAMRRAIEKLNDVFTDTLEDIEITIHAFIIAPPTDAGDILAFADMDALREYMSGHPNPPLADDARKNFEAYSQYIDTVLEYIGKI